MNTFIITLATVGVINPIISINNDDLAKLTEYKHLEVITPSHTSIDSRKIQDYTSEYIMYVKNEKNERESVGFYSEELQRVQLNEEQTIRLKKSEIIDGKSHVHMSMSSAKSMRPKYSIVKSEDVLKMVNFDGTHIDAEIILNGKTTTFSDVTEVPYFDANTTDLIIRSLPLKKGYSATYWAYNTDKMNSLDYQTVSVVGETQTKIGSDQLVTAWVVSKVSSDSIATYTIEKESHTILKIELALQDGKTMVIEKI